MSREGDKPVPVNPYPPLHPAWAGTEHIAWDEGYDEGFAAALAAVLSDQAVEAASRKFEPSTWATPACKWREGALDDARYALAAAVDAVKEGATDE